jgi:small subunit ribosomal protein S8
MQVTDPIADLLTRIRNAGMARLETLSVPASRLKIEIVMLLKEHRWIRDFRLVQDSKQGLIEIKLNLNPNGESVIRKIQRVSKPGCRIYSGWKNIPVARRGLGLVIVSTSRGVLDGRQAIANRLGGEILAKVW